MKYLLTILLFALCFNAAAQVYNEDTVKYMKYPNSYGPQYPTLWATKIMRLPDTTNNRPQQGVPGAIGRNTAGTAVFIWDGSVWRPVGSGGGSGIRDTAKLSAGYGLIIVCPDVNDDNGFYGPNYSDCTIILDTSVLDDFIVQVINSDTTIINNNSDTARFIVDTIANSPPVGATDGYKVLVGAVSGNIVVANPTGLFAGHGEEVAELVGSVWTFQTPDNNDQLIVDNANNYSTWQYSNGVWRVTARLARWGGDRGLGRNSFLGKLDKQPVFIRAWNKVGLMIDTTRKVYTPVYSGLETQPLYYKPGANGLLDTGRFKIPVYDSPVNPDSVLYIDNGEFKYGTASGGGGSQTWQQTLDVGSTLDKDNTIGGNFHSFAMDSLSFLSVNAKEPSATVSSNLDVSSGGTSISTSNVNNASVISQNPGYNEIYNINLGDTSYRSIMYVTQDYFQFKKETSGGLPFPVSVPINPKIIYPSDTLLTEPEYIAAFDNDTIKKYPFSGGGGSSLFPLTGTGTATGDVAGIIGGNILNVSDGSNDLLNINPTSFANSFKATDGTASSSLLLAGNSSGGVGVGFSISTTDGVNTNSISADPTINSISYDAGTHTFNGNTVFANNGAPGTGKTLHGTDANGNWLWDTIIYKDDAKSMVGINTTEPASLLDIYTVFPGTVSTTSGSATVTGTDTRFQDFFNPGDRINIDGNIVFILSISSQTSLTLTSAFGSTLTNVSYRNTANTNSVFSIKSNGNMYLFNSILARNMSPDNLRNTSFGVGAMSNITTGNNITAFGREALENNTTGQNNTAIGRAALSGNTTGTGSNAFGYNALANNTTGDANTAVGYSTLFSNTTGIWNTAIGTGSLYANTTGSHNIAIGVNSLESNTTGGANIAMALYSLDNNLTGNSNIALGYTALRYLNAKDNNIAIGIGAGIYDAGLNHNTGSENSIFIGKETYPLTASGTNEIVIGASAVGHGSNSATIGNSSVTDTWLGGTTKLHITLGTAPASASASGVAGTVIITTDYIYVCTATDTWKRTPISTW